MESSKLTLAIFCLLCISTLSSQLEPSTRKNTIVRHKKKIISLKKPLRPQNRPGRQSGFIRETTNDFVATSENPGSSWKPITYAVYSEGPHDTKPTEDSTAVNTDKPQPRQEDQIPDQNQDYTLFQYYIPFEQLITHPKPITEPPLESPKEPISYDRLQKAAIEPVPVFKKENEGESSHSEHDNEFTGRYEYEYFVQDDHWGTNFGHKEYRDEKYTKGSYEVVLPDGRVQHVKYWSDATGYHASVSYHPLYQKFKHSK